MSAKSEAAGRFKAEVCSSKRCWFCNRRRFPFELDACHLIPAQRLRAHTSTLPEDERLAIVYDPRLAVPGCNRQTKENCHHRFDHYFIRIAYEQLPAQTLEAAEEHGLGWSLTRDYISIGEGAS